MLDFDDDAWGGQSQSVGVGGVDGGPTFVPLLSAVDGGRGDDRVGDALGQIQVFFKDHYDRAHEGIMLALGVLGEVVGKLVGQSFAAPL